MGPSSIGVPFSVARISPRAVTYALRHHPEGYHICLCCDGRKLVVSHVYCLAEGLSTLVLNCGGLP